MTTPPTSTPPAQPARPRIGCAAWLILLPILLVVFGLGYRWLFLVLPDIVTTTGPRWQIDLSEAATYALAVGAFGLFALLVFRRSANQLWRGIGLTLTLAALHALLVGGLLALDRALAWPGLPYLVPPLGSLLFTAVVVYLLRDVYLRSVQGAFVLFGLVTGLLIGASFTLIGSLGTGLEALLSVGDALATAAIAALLLTSSFVFTRELFTESPRLVAIVSALMLTAVAPGLLAVRGFWLQGQILTLVLIVAGLPAALLVFFAPPLRSAHVSAAALALFFGALFTPMLLLEGQEGDILLADTSFLLSWIAPLGASIVVALLTTAVLLILLLTAKNRVRRLVTQLVPMAGLAGLMALLLGGLYALSGGRWFQPDIFFLVLADQTDTTFAEDITARDERTLAVYTHLTTHASQTQTGLRQTLTESGLTFTPFYLVNAIEVKGNLFARWQLGRHTAVDRILPSPHVRPQRSAAFLQPQDELADLTAVARAPGELSWGVVEMDANRVWDELGVDGTGIVVGSADSGVDWQHEALRDGYLGDDSSHDYTWFDPGGGASEPIDTNGHGTHTSGTTLGRGGIGVAPGASWIACRNLARNLGNPADYLACMQFLFAPFPQGGDPFTDGDPLRGAHLTNNSWGCPPEEGCDNRTLSIGIGHLRHAGQLMVISAGNEGPACATIWSPASADDGLIVGAVDANGRVTEFSSRGPATAPDGTLRILPDVVAPGDAIVSSQPGNRYTAASGTSMAGPHAAGLVALLWSANPALIGDIATTEQVLRDTAVPVDAPFSCTPVADDKDNVTGYGMVNAYEAVLRVLEP